MGHRPVAVVAHMAVARRMVPVAHMVAGMAVADLIHHCDPGSLGRRSRLASISLVCVEVLSLQRPSHGPGAAVSAASAGAAGAASVGAAAAIEAMPPRAMRMDLAKYMLMSEQWRYDHEKLFHGRQVFICTWSLL
jgi:hypothetical protein